MNLRFNCKHEDCGNGEFIRLPIVSVTLKGARGKDPLNFTAILDTGSAFVLIPQEMADELGLEYDSTDTQKAKGYCGENFTTTASTVDITIQRGHEHIDVRCRCAIQLDGEKEHENLIIGSSFFDQVKVEFDYPNNKFYIKEPASFWKGKSIK